ncbi:uncharacterized protein METZ01_LOCUS441771, partial [marine metagenome]
MLEQSPKSDAMVGGFAKSIRECFSFDTNPLNPTPKGIIKKILALWLYPRYSMSVYLRLAQYFHYRDAEKGGMFLLLAYFFRRRNEVKNNFEVNFGDYIGPGVIFHHTGVTITAGSVIEPGVHIYNNVTLGSRNGEAPYIKKGAKLCSHTVILGGVTVGEKAIVAPG